MKRILEIDFDNAWMRVEPGVINLDVSQAAGAARLLLRARSVVAERLHDRRQRRRELGRRALPQVRLHHQPRARRAPWCCPTARSSSSAAPVADPLGYDLRGALVGSEGTLGVVTEVVLRILRQPEATRTFFATFPSTDEAGNAVSLIIAAGIVPAAIEMMDRLAIVAVKAATGVDWPDVGAALLMDVDGPLAEVEHTAAEANRLGARGRRARDPRAARRRRARR